MSPEDSPAPDPSPGQPDPGPRHPAPAPLAPPRPPRWWRRPLAVSTMLALALHLPLTPAMPLWRALQRLAILREPPREEEHPELPDMTVELLAPPSTAPEPTAGPDAVALPPAAPAPAPARPPTGRPAAKEADDRAAKAEAARAEEARKEAEKRAAERARTAREVAPGPENAPGHEADDGQTGRFAQGNEETTGDERTSPDGTEAGRGGRVGLRGKVTEKTGKPTVSLALWLGEMREHVLGGSVGALLACNPDWKPFLQRGIRPLDDLAGLLIVGPQLTSSKRMAIAVEHRLDAERVRGELDALVQRSGGAGKWLEEGVAQVVVQRQKRVIFGRPPSMLFVAPADRWKELAAPGESVSLPSSRGRAAAFQLQRPGAALRRVGVEVPASISELRLEVFANRDGSVDAQLDFEDASVADAMRHAEPLGRSLGQLTADLTQLGRTASSLAPASVAGDLRDEDFKLPTPELTAVGPRLTTTLRLTAAQTGKLLGLIARATCPKKAPPGR